MKRIITSAFVVLLTISAAQAQTATEGQHKHHKKEQSHKGSKKAAFEKLNLTADQKNKLQALKEDFKKQHSALKENKSLTEEQKKAQRKELHQQYRTKAETIFTKEQKEQLAQMKKDRKSQRGERKEQFKGSGRKDAAFGRGKEGQKLKLKEELGLTEDQQIRLESIRKEYRTKFNALRSNESLTREQKKEQFQTLRKQQQEQMKTVLTKEQAEKLQSFRKEHARNTR